MIGEKGEEEKVEIHAWVTTLSARQGADGEQGQLAKVGCQEVRDEGESIFPIGLLSLLEWCFQVK